MSKAKVWNTTVHLFYGYIIGSVACYHLGANAMWAGTAVGCVLIGIRLVSLFCGRKAQEEGKEKESI